MGSKVEYFVLPMLQFFSLPDYCFEDVTVPDWVFTPPPPPVQEQPGVTPAAVSTGGSNEKGERGPRAGTIMEPPFSLLPPPSSAPGGAAVGKTAPPRPVAVPREPRKAGVLRGHAKLSPVAVPRGDAA